MIIENIFKIEQTVKKYTNFVKEEMDGYIIHIDKNIIIYRNKRLPSID